MFWATGPLAPCPTSYWTFWFSSSERYPLPAIPVYRIRVVPVPAYTLVPVVTFRDPVEVRVGLQSGDETING
jgi:hypothetical protein